jgi:magnesium transporter
MKFYLIKEKLEECTMDDIKESSVPYVAVLNSKEYAENKDYFNMGVDIDLDIRHVRDTKVVVNYDALTGTLNVPDNFSFSDDKFKLGFVLDETGIVLVDEDNYTENLVDNIRLSRKWRLPSLERFLYDFLEETIRPDPVVLENVSGDLDQIEQDIMKGKIETYPVQLNDIRSWLLDLHMHYEHLIDLSKELEENENGFFQEENLRYFRLFGDRVMRLQDMVGSMRDYIVQLRNLIGEQLAIKQNHIMTLLTVVTTIFMPLTVIAGWFGMNFTNMPSINSPYGYPLTILGSISIVLVSLWWFRKKKWL